MKILKNGTNFEKIMRQKQHKFINIICNLLHGYKINTLKIKVALAVHKILGHTHNFNYTVFIKRHINILTQEVA